MTPQQNQAIQNALYAQQDQAQGLGQQATVYVPRPGEVVVVESLHHCDEKDPRFAPMAGSVVVVESVVDTGDGIVLLNQREPRVGFYCRVRPASAIDVECPLATRGECDGVVGHACCGGVNSVARPPHMERQLRFTELTGQAPKDSATPSGVVTPVGPEPEGDSGTGRAEGSEAAGPSLQPAAPSGFPKCVHCESSSAMAIGHADWCPVHRAHVMEQPHPPSGFRAPESVFDVDCEACGAKGARSHTADRTAAFCREDGRRVEPHALRVAAFEARRERPEPTKIMGDWPLEKCRIEKCDQEARHAGYCADCAGEIDPRDDFRALQRGRAKGILRTELDRPLPKPAALKTWPADSGEEYEL